MRTILTWTTVLENLTVVDMFKVFTCFIKRKKEKKV